LAPKLLPIGCMMVVSGRLFLRSRRLSEAETFFRTFCRYFPKVYRSKFDLALHGILMGYLAESLRLQTKSQTARLLAMSIWACPYQALFRQHRFTIGMTRLLVMPRRNSSVAAPS